MGEHRFEPDVHPASHLFHEAVFTVHMAVRVSCAAAQQATDGLPTWSISTAYHGSMLALRGLLGLCGIAYLETEGRYFLMDAFPSARKGTRQKRRRQSQPILSASTNEVQLIRVPRMENRHWWLVFQRLLRTSAALFSRWSYPFDTRLSRCKAQVVSRHRNKLHYRGVWYYEDLFEKVIFDSFGQFDAEGCQTVVDKLQEENGSDGTLMLNQILLGISIAMLRDLAGVSRRVEPEIKVIDHTIQQFTNDIVSTWY